MPGHRGGSSHLGERDCHTEKHSKPVIAVSPGCTGSVSQDTWGPLKTGEGEPGTGSFEIQQKAGVILKAGSHSSRTRYRVVRFSL